MVPLAPCSQFAPRASVATTRSPTSSSSSCPSRDRERARCSSTVGAASLNHHDLWTLRGDRLAPADRAAGARLRRRRDGARVRRRGAPPRARRPVGATVVVHSVMTCGHCAACRTGDELHCPHVGLLSEPPYPGTLAERLVVPVANVLPLPDSVDVVTAACLPTAYLTAYRMLFVRGGAAPGTAGARPRRHRRGGQRGHHPRRGGGPHRVRDLARRGQAHRRARARRRGRVRHRPRRVQAGDRRERGGRRRRARHGGRGHLGLLAARAAARRHRRGLGRHDAGPTRRPSSTASSGATSRSRGAAWALARSSPGWCSSVRAARCSRSSTRCARCARRLPRSPSSPVVSGAGSWSC